MTNISITPVTKSRITEVDFDNLGFGKIFSDHMFVAGFRGNPAYMATSFLKPPQNMRLPSKGIVLASKLAM